MALAVDVTDRRSPSNEMHHQLQPKKTKAGCIIRLHSSKRRFSCPSLLTTQSALFLKVGVAYGWLKPLKDAVLPIMA